VIAIGPVGQQAKEIFQRLDGERFFLPTLDIDRNTRFFGGLARKNTRLLDASPPPKRRRLALMMHHTLNH
jgi:hypothetical protein